MGQSILLVACGMVPLLVEVLCQAIQRARLYDQSQCYISIGQRCFFFYERLTNNDFMCFYKNFSLIFRCYTGHQ